MIATDFVSSGRGVLIYLEKVHRILISFPHMCHERQHCKHARRKLLIIHPSMIIYDGIRGILVNRTAISSTLIASVKLMIAVNELGPTT